MGAGFVVKNDIGALVRTGSIPITSILVQKTETRDL